MELEHQNLFTIHRNFILSQNLARLIFHFLTHFEMVNLACSKNNRHEKAFLKTTDMKKSIQLLSIPLKDCSEPTRAVLDFETFVALEFEQLSAIISAFMHFLVLPLLF